MIALIKQHQRIFLFILIAHLIFPFFSLGMHHSDEHFQILEFLNFKLGGISSTDLPWEFQEQIRPWAQPAFFFVLIKYIFYPLGITSPLLFNIFFRLLASLLGFISLGLIATSCQKLYQDAKKSRECVIWCAGLWFLPYIHARLSGENFSSFFFILAFSLFIDQNWRHHKWSNMTSGILFGIAFTIRFQLAFAIFGLCLWALLSNQRRMRDLSVVTFFFALSLLLMACIDLWGYGNWAFPPYNYYIQNIKLAKASGFGVSPWWEYFKLVALKAIPPLSFLILYSFFRQTYKKFLDPVTFILIFFVLVHSIVGHKELRFLFPMASFLPIIIANNFSLSHYLFSSSARKAFFLILAALPLFISLTKIDHHTKFHIQFSRLKDRPLKVTLYKSDNPFMYTNLKMKFYIPDPPLVTINNDLDTLVGHVFADQRSDQSEIMSTNRCEKIFTHHSDFFMRFSPSSKNWGLFWCSK